MAAERHDTSELPFGVTLGEPVARDERLEIVDVAAAHAFDEYLRWQNNGQNVLMLSRIAMNALTSLASSEAKRASVTAVPQCSQRNVKNWRTSRA